MNATGLWMLWQAILAPYADCFTRPGFHRFVEWLTGLALNVEEHTITQSLVGLERTDDWKALEAFAEYGAWDRDYVERVTAQLLENAPGRVWHGFHVGAGDDTKVHRTSKHVWGTNTFHEYTARCPNLATTVRAHNWVVVGGLLHDPEQPAWFVPVASRLYFRKSQLPDPGSNGGAPVSFQTKCELMVELGQQQARSGSGKHLLVVDGGYALRNVLRPLVDPTDGSPRVDVLTRLRHDARLYDLPPDERRPGQRGRMPRWGRRLPPPRQGGRWPGPWQTARAFVYGRVRQVRWKERCALWHVTGADRVVKVVVAAVEGYRARFTLVTTAVVLSGVQVVELFCARFRQEDGFRDLKQRLGWEECRAWTRQPIERTTQALLVCLTLLRLLEFHLEAAGYEDWWQPPPWNPRKTRPSVLDLERLLRRHAAGIRRLLSAWLGERETTASAEPPAAVASVTDQQRRDKSSGKRPGETPSRSRSPEIICTKDSGIISHKNPRNQCLMKEPRLLRQVELHPYPLLFVTISGADHLYGFPSPDSDYDLRGVHLLPLTEVVGLKTGQETVEKSGLHDGLEIDLVTHDARKFFGLLLKKNGYVLEQLLSPLVVHTTPEHAELKEIAKTCVTRHHAHHYLGFAETQWRLFQKEDSPHVKPLLYVYRVLLTGIHLMRTGEIQANLGRLNESFKLAYLPELIERKVGGTEKGRLEQVDVGLHQREYERLRAELEQAYQESKLPEVPLGTKELDELLVRIRLGRLTNEVH